MSVAVAAHALGEDAQLCKDGGGHHFYRMVEQLAPAQVASLGSVSAVRAFPRS
jgi:hypothetical protein